MTIKTKIILEPTTSATVSDTFQLENDNTAVTITSTGYGAGETATLEFFNEISQTWELYTLDEGGVTHNPFFSNLGNNIEISNNFSKFRFNKTATAEAVGIYVRQWLYS